MPRRPHPHPLTPPPTPRPQDAKGKLAPNRGEQPRARGLPGRSWAPLTTRGTRAQAPGGEAAHSPWMSLWWNKALCTQPGTSAGNSSEPFPLRILQLPRKLTLTTMAAEPAPHNASSRSRRRSMPVAGTSPTHGAKRPALRWAAEVTLCSGGARALALPAPGPAPSSRPRPRLSATPPGQLS